jgi:hypothetical protein
MRTNKRRVYIISPFLAGVASAAIAGMTHDMKARYVEYIPGGFMIFGLLLMLIGGFLNCLVLIVNGFMMPAFRKYPPIREYDEVSGYIINDNNVKLGFLADRYYGRFGIKSIGDIFLTVGMAFGGLGIGIFLEQQLMPVGFFVGLPFVLYALKILL